MKSIAFSLLFLFIPKLCISQILPNDLLIYLDSIENHASIENHQYFRIIKDYKLKKESYIVNDYYKTGVIKMRSTSENKDYIKKEGQTIFYYENKNKKSICNYTKNHPDGKEFKWYENGNKKEDGEHQFDEKKKQSRYKVNQFWDTNGVQKVTDGNGDYEENDKNFFGSGKVKDGYKDGVWQGWVENPKNKYTETYENGKLTSGTIVDENNIESTYAVLEKKPEPENGMSDFYEFIRENYKLPNNLPKSTRGKIYVKFIVDINGKIVDIKIIRDLGYGTGAEAVRVLSNYNNFTPAEQRGQKVRCTYSLPIKINTN